MNESVLVNLITQSISCSFLYFIYRELKEIRLNYVPHTICEERRESCRYPKRRRQNRTD
ncbi:MAG: hypothetical protein ACI4OV_08130 [Victivallaceae bacterium]